MQIKSSSSLRNDYDNIVRLSRESGEPVYITRNGEGEMVFTTIEDYERKKAELKLMAELLKAERNRLSGAPTFSVKDVRKELEAIYAEG